ncbi:hypothetical protein ACOME3_001976 [Neoechinorhynchus agilis]
MAAWTPFDLTYVQYRAGDPIGFCMAFCSVLPMFVIFSFGVLVILRRDMQTIFLFIGCFLCEFLNRCLKLIFRIERPDSENPKQLHHYNYGMPSSHAQQMSFICCYFMLIIEYRTILDSSFYPLSGRLAKILVHCCSISLAFIVSLSRVYLEYHSIDQVVVGAGFGIVFASIYFHAVNNIFSVYFNMLARSYLGQLLMLRDYAHIDDLLYYQYQSEMASVLKTD